MQPRGPLLEENMFVAVQRDNLPPLRVNTTMNIGRSRTTCTRSRKKAKIATDAVECAAKGNGRRGGRAGKTRGRRGRRGRGSGEQSHVAHEELNSTQSAPGEY